MCLLTLISHLTYSRDLSHSDTKTLFDFTYCAEITADAVTAMREYSFTPHRGSGYIVATPQLGGIARAGFSHRESALPDPLNYYSELRDTRKRGHKKIRLAAARRLRKLG